MDDLSYSLATTVKQHDMERQESFLNSLDYPKSAPELSLETLGTGRCILVAQHKP